jgi:hypothetical protein
MRRGGRVEAQCRKVAPVEPAFEVRERLCLPRLLCRRLPPSLRTRLAATHATVAAAAAGKVRDLLQHQRLL